MFESKERYPLRDILIDDLFSSNKLVIALLAAIVLTAVGTVWLTHQTRGLISQKGDLQLENQMLEAEFRNLKLEETTQGDSSRIESIARTLGMQRVSGEQEVVIQE